MASSTKTSSTLLVSTVTAVALGSAVWWYNRKTEHRRRGLPTKYQQLVATVSKRVKNIRHPTLGPAQLKENDRRDVGNPDDCVVEERDVQVDDSASSSAVNRGDAQDERSVESLVVVETNKPPNNEHDGDEREETSTETLESAADQSSSVDAETPEDSAVQQPPTVQEVVVAPTTKQGLQVFTGNNNESDILPNNFLLTPEKKSPRDDFSIADESTASFSTQGSSRRSIFGTRVADTYNLEKHNDDHDIFLSSSV
jgi:hypothetical protein